MKLRPATLVSLTTILLALSGCSSYVQRIVMQSLGRLGSEVPAPPAMITTPMVPNANLAIGWVGHATVLIQLRDKLIITDPFLTNTMGLIAKRFFGPGLDAATLSKVEATLISHIHFDHLNFGSLAMLPKNGVLAIPEGAAECTPDFGFKEVYELKQWQAVEDDGIRITAVPAQHFTGRYGFDGAWLGTLGYTGYIVEHDSITVYFAGDTGYNPELFKEIGRRFKVDLAIVPIAPGSLTGIGGRVHVGPAGALMIYKDLGAKFLMPMHYGTLFYGLDSNPNEPMERLREIAAKEGLSERIIGLAVGEQRVLF